MAFADVKNVADMAGVNQHSQGLAGADYVVLSLLHSLVVGGVVTLDASISNPVTQIVNALRDHLGVAAGNCWALDAFEQRWQHERARWANNQGRGA
jgi:hypothetical protein